MVNEENYTENWDRFNDSHDHANQNPVILLWNNKQYVHKDTILNWKKWNAMNAKPNY